MYCLVRGGGGCEIRTREGLPPTRFPTMLARVHRRPPPSANCTNTIRANTGERSRTGVNETQTETGGQVGPCGAARLRSGHRRRPDSYAVLAVRLSAAELPRRPAGRPGRRGTANGTSAPVWPASTATRRTPARAASRRPARGSTARPKQPSPPASRSYAAGDHWRPGGPAQSPANTPQRCARCHL